MKHYIGRNLLDMRSYHTNSSNIVEFVSDNHIKILPSIGSTMNPIVFIPDQNLVKIGNRFHIQFEVKYDGWRKGREYDGIYCSFCNSGAVDRNGGYNFWITSGNGWKTVDFNVDITCEPTSTNLPQDCVGLYIGLIPMGEWADGGGGTSRQ